MMTAMSPRGRVFDTTGETVSDSHSAGNQRATALLLGLQDRDFAANLYQWHHPVGS